MICIRPRQALPLAVGLVCAIPAGAQTLEPAGTLPQIAPAASGNQRVDGGQIGSPGRTVAAAEVTPGARATRGTPPAQLARPGDTAPTTQLAPAARSARAPAQLAPDGRDARPPAPLSTPAQGRTAAVSRVEGRDRCDPAAPAAAGARCDTVIETRGGEFPPPSREPLSPEQRLLVEQRTLEARQREPASTTSADAIARSAARGSGREGADADAPVMQGIASVVLAPPPTPPASPAGDTPVEGLTPEQAVSAIGIPGFIGTTRP